MPDPRFYPVPPELTLGEAAEITGALPGRGANPDFCITGLAPLRIAGAGDLSFLTGRAHLKLLHASAAGACLVPPALEDAGAPNPLVHDDPQMAFVRLAERLYPEPPPAAGAAPGARVSSDAEIGAGCEIAPSAVVCARAEIGRGSRIGPGAVIGAGVVLGEGARIGANVTIEYAIVGARLRVHAGAAIGQDGFSYVPGPAGPVKIPQLGRVLIGDDVEIGANTTVDRGAGEDTVVGDGCKIDNLVQIGHNCRLGRGVIVVSQVGISGSVTVGDFVVLGGQVGVADHIEIGSGARIAAGSGVTKAVPPGAVWAGMPARPAGDWRREVAILRRLVRKRGGDG